jgi:SAM-dependent methyltransferase
VSRDPGQPRISLDTRRRVSRLASAARADDDATGWFERLYASAAGDDRQIPWADLEPHPLLVEWLARERVQGAGRRALVVGCGLGDDAEHLARLGFAVTAFDVAPTAVAWARRRHAGSPVEYVTADLLDLPAGWHAAFDLVAEIYTLQSLPPGDVRERAVRALASPPAPGGRLLVVCRGRDDEAPVGTIPWPLSRAELAGLARAGLEEVSLEDVVRDEPAQRWFRATYTRSS